MNLPREPPQTSSTKRGEGKMAQGDIAHSFLGCREDFLRPTTASPTEQALTRRNTALLLFAVEAQGRGDKAIEGSSVSLGA